MDSASPFDLFGREHFVTVAVIAAIIVGVTAWGRRQSRQRALEAGRVMAVLLVLYRLSETVFRIRILEHPWQETFPFHLCGILYLVQAWALWRGGQWAFELVYFWTFAGTLHSLITPDVTVGYPHPEWWSYFLSHGLLILCASYATFSLKQRPEPGSIRRAFVATNIWAATVLPLNLLLGTNYMFLRAKPPTTTLFDLLGPWPWYLLVLEVLALASFALCYVPWALLDRRRAAASFGAPGAGQPAAGRGPGE